MWITVLPDAVTIIIINVIFILIVMNITVIIIIVIVFFNVSIISTMIIIITIITILINIHLRNNKYSCYNYYYLSSLSILCWTFTEDIVRDG